MLDRLDFNKLLFLDIETTGICGKIDELPDRKRELFLKKFRNDSNTEMSDQELWESQSPLHAEFGKVISICITFYNHKKEQFLTYRFFKTDSEKELLESFYNKFKKVLELLQSDYTICSYNGDEFDFIFLAKRFLINELPIPRVFDYSEIKPWEKQGLHDLKKIYSYGLFKHYVSLDLLCDTLDIESPKKTMSGDKVFSFYYDSNKKNRERNKEMIADYCSEDTLALAKCYIKIMKLDFKDIKTEYTDVI